jgi:organic hydroperoxide reductase OsmC/OhrA
MSLPGRQDERMAALKVKELRFAIDLGEGGSLRVEDGTLLDADPAWSPEHLLLAALVRCSLKSLAYHARRAGLEVAHATGSARALITKRESDGRYAMVECDVEFQIRLSPEPGPEQLAELHTKAERDCFVGASLAVTPTYHWS